MIGSQSGHIDQRGTQLLSAIGRVRLACHIDGAGTIIRHSPVGIIQTEITVITGHGRSLDSQAGGGIAIARIRTDNHRSIGSAGNLPANGKERD